MSAWTFTHFERTGCVAATEPDGTKHFVRGGDLRTLDGSRLLNAMVRDLKAERQVVAYGIFAKIPDEGWVLQFPNYRERVDAERAAGTFVATAEIEVRPLYA